MINTNNFNQNSHIVVVGGGIIGLSAAGALSPFVKQVTLLEKDRYPMDSLGSRKSIPQGHHIHILLQAGLNELNKLFPGLSNSLTDSGAAVIDAGMHQRSYEFGAWSAQRNLGIKLLGFSRWFLEHHVLSKIKEISNIDVRQQTRALEIQVNTDNHINGIEIDMGHGDSEIIKCDGIIDAGGAGSSLFKQGLISSKDVIVEKQDINIFYSTLHFKSTSTHLRQSENILIVPQYNNQIGASLLDIENNRICISLHGGAACRAPQDIDEWLQIVKNQLPNDAVWQRIQKAEIISKLFVFKKKHSIWKKFEANSEVLIKNYLPIGDVISQLNPIFGQGMTVGIGHASALSSAMSCGFENYQDFAVNYLNGAANWSERAWKKTTAYSAMLSNIDNQENLFYQLAKQKFLRSHEDENLHLALIKQSQMLD